MASFADLLQRHGIKLESMAAGRYYTTCPQCSKDRRKPGHKNAECLGITIGPDDSIRWGCNHCGWTGPEKGSGRGERTRAVYYYYGERLRKARGENGVFWWEHRDGNGRWIKGTDGADTKILYRFDEVRRAIADGRPIAVAEGEKDVDNLWRIGIPATCNAHGASEPGKKPKWLKAHSEYLAGADLVVFNDDDPAGHEHADTVCKLSLGVANRVRRLDLAPHWPEIPKGGDVSDYLAAGHTAAHLEELVAAAPDYARAASAQDNTAPRWAAATATDAPEFSDESLALAFTAEYGSDLRYVAAWNRWFRWGGARWAHEPTLLAFDLARAICRDAAEVAGPQAFAKGITSSKTVASVVALARVDRQHAATVDQWDADPWLLNTPGGMVDLVKGRLEPHRREAYCTKTTGAEPGNHCPLWLTFLDRIFAGNADLIAFVQRVIGYALTGITREHALFFGYGTGANGKSVLLSTIGSVLGDYARSAPIETFTSSAFERHPTDLASLRGARLVTAIETEEGRYWAENRIKALTGGDKIAARFMRQDFFEFTPAFKLFIAGNHKPRLRSVDEAIRRRLHLIPFSVTIPEAERDPHLTNKLEDERRGILGWAIKGCLEWQRIGLAPPKVVKDATAEYLQAEDATAAWLEERCLRDPQAWTATGILFVDWTRWATGTGEHASNIRRFTQNLESRGFEPQRRMNGRGFIGLRLMPSEADPPPWREAP